MPKRLVLQTTAFLILAACVPIPGAGLSAIPGPPSPTPTEVVRPEMPACEPKPVDFLFTFEAATSKEDRAIIKEAARFARGYFPLKFHRGPKYVPETNAWRCHPAKSSVRVRTTSNGTNENVAGSYQWTFISLYTDPSWWPYAQENFKYRLVLHEAYHLYQDLATLRTGNTQSRRELRWFAEGSAVWAEYDAAIRMGEWPSMDAARAEETSLLRHSRSELPSFERYRRGDALSAYPLFFLAVDQLLRDHGGAKAMRAYWEYEGEDDDWWVVFEKAFGLKAKQFYREFAGG